MSPQCSAIIKHLFKAGSISNLEAITIHRIYALPRRISDLEALGFEFIRERRKDVTNKRYVRYFLKAKKIK